MKYYIQDTEEKDWDMMTALSAVYICVILSTLFLTHGVSNGKNTSDNLSQSSHIDNSNRLIK
jgi:hypothetical protein